MYFGIQQLIACILFEFLTDDTIKELKLYSYAGKVIYRNNIQIALKYYDMEHNYKTKFAFYEDMIDRFGGNKIHYAALFECYVFCMCRCFKNEKYETAFYFFGIIKKLYGINAIKNLPMIDIDLANGIEYFISTATFEELNKDKIKDLIDATDDQTIKSRKLYIYVAENVYENDCEKLVKYYGMESDTNKKFQYYQQILEVFGNDENYTDLLQKCYRFCVKHLCRKKQYQLALIYYDGIINILEVKGYQHVVGGLAGYLISTDPSNHTKIESLIQLIQDDRESIIKKYKIHTYFAEVMHPNDCELMIKYFGMETNVQQKIKYYENVIEKFS
eukprot:287373_1